MEVNPRVRMSEEGMGGETTTRRRREMQAEDFQRLLARLHPDPAQASEAYEQLRKDLVKFFCNRQQSFRAEELADATLDEIAKKPSSYPIEDVGQFAIGVARFVRLESLRRQPAVLGSPIVQNLSVDNPEHTVIYEIDWEQKLKCFSQCMEGFKPAERWLILEYYPAESRDLEERRRKLAETLQIDPHALTSRMNRLRSKLVKCCAACYNSGTRKTDT